MVFPALCRAGELLDSQPRVFSTFASGKEGLETRPFSNGRAADLRMCIFAVAQYAEDKRTKQERLAGENRCVGWVGATWDFCSTRQAATIQGRFTDQ